MEIRPLKKRGIIRSDMALFPPWLFWIHEFGLSFSSGPQYLRQVLAFKADDQLIKYVDDHSRCFIREPFREQLF